MLFYHRNRKVTKTHSYNDRLLELQGLSHRGQRCLHDMKYNAVRYLVGPRLGVPLRNHTMQLIWYKGFDLGEGKGLRACEKGWCRWVDLHADRQTDGQTRTEPCGQRRGWAQRRIEQRWGGKSLAGSTWGQRERELECWTGLLYTAHLAAAGDAFPWRSLVELPGS